MARPNRHYYERYSPVLPIRLAWRVLWAHSRIQKVALLNRQRDYRALNGRPDLLALHWQLNAILDRAARDWQSHDYGEGYFYQGLRRIGVTGLRDTEARVAAMDLVRRVHGKRVLEIGCNTGFLSLSIAGAAAQVEAFDVNPFLVEIGTTVADHLKIENVDFTPASFEDFATSTRFDAVLSFANHSTYDGNTKQSIEEYFRRCKDFMLSGGLLLFESHPPEHEGEGLGGVCEIIGRLFHIEEQAVLRYGTFLDDRRTFIVARKRRV